MKDITFDAIASGIATPSHRPVGGRLNIASAPDPFVPPIFHDQSDDGFGLREVVLIRASAAVGKSTIAHALSASRQVPVLDLSQTAVATGSLAGLLSDLRNGVSATEAFHAGRLPIIIDALDEGRLLSGENGLLSFFETAAETIAEDRSTVNAPKLILLGRPDAVAYAQLYFADKGVTISHLDVGFFKEDGARKLIHAYATKFAKGDSLYLVHQKPAEEFITTYFQKIEAALGITEGNLWEDDQGRSFAGYAPVLAAIGSLLPEIDNFADAQQRLNDAGTEDAWGVIEGVLIAIVEREQGKIRDLFVKAGGKADSPGLYDAEEQVSLLLQHVQKLPLSGAGHIKLAGADAGLYDRLVQQWLPEHPFIREGKFSNNVIASFLLSKSVLAGQRLEDELLLKEAARQPFLWRSMRGKLSENILIDGSYLGYVLNSFWSDPLTQADAASIIDGHEATTVSIRADGLDVAFPVTTPVMFYGRVRNTTVSIHDAASFIGAGHDNAAFIFEGVNNLVAGVSALHASQMRVRGDLWLDTDMSLLTGQLSLNIEPGTVYGWGESLINKYPFSKNDGNRSQPGAQPLDDQLYTLLVACSAKTQGTTIATLTDYSGVPNDFLYSVYQRSPENFKALIATLVSHGFAETSPMQAAGPAKLRIRLKLSFGNLASELDSGGSTPELRELLQELRARIY
ncbi:hypothetical protein [Sphingomonas sp. Leaf37]|uniref:hypothetical protein n=1 Tax=Sphingomonas sp. Leaf37 TaxID=2876552 RepID=UPI001E3FDA0D|nr:hypothetical protein [Sphingomonas sp. Leaf37]